MKKILIIFLWLFLSITVKADEECNLYLKSLDILDYKISPTFHKYQDTYTVFIPSDIFYLDLTYQKETNNSLVTIRNNDNLENQSVVYLDITCEEKTNSYKIIVNKEAEKLAFKETNISNNFTKKDRNLTICLIGGGLLLLWLILGFIFFKKRKVKLANS